MYSDYILFVGLIYNQYIFKTIAFLVLCLEAKHVSLLSSSLLHEDYSMENPRIDTPECVCVCVCGGGGGQHNFDNANATNQCNSSFLQPVLHIRKYIKFWQWQQSEQVTTACSQERAPVVEPDKVQT